MKKAFSALMVTAVLMIAIGFQSMATSNVVTKPVEAGSAGNGSKSDYLARYYRYYYSSQQDSREFFYYQRDWNSRCGK